MGAGSKAPGALASFSYDWVGGDIRGLSAFAGTLYGYVPEIGKVSSALNSKVSQIVGDAGWQGAAATSFARAWEHDSAGASALALVITATGDAVSQLAVNLSRIENALESAARQVEAHGVPVGADGQGPSACYADPARESWRSSYQAFWGQCMLAAASARTSAAGALQQVSAAIAPPGSSDSGVGKGDMAALGDELVGFWGAQTRFRAFVEGKIPGLKQSLGQAITDAREEARQANGRFGKWTDQGKESFGGAKTELESVEQDLAAAKSGENLFSRVWGFSPADIPGVGAALEEAPGPLGNALRFGADIPVVDVLAATAGTYFAAQDDIAKGVPWQVAYPGEATSNVAALAIGAGVGNLAVGGVAAGLGAAGATGLGVSLVAGGAGVVVGGIVAYGVADFGHNLIDENWGADIHQHGVVLGVADGIGDSAVQTGKDFVHLGSSVAHGVEHVWNSIF